MDVLRHLTSEGHARDGVEGEVFAPDPFEPRRLLLELQTNQIEYAERRRRELGLVSIGAYLRTLLCEELERRNGAV